MSDRATGGGPPKAEVPGGLRRWILPMALLAALWASQSFMGRPPAQPEIGYTDFYALVEADKIESVTLTGREVTGKLRALTQVGDKELTEFQVRLPAQEDPGLLPALRSGGARVEVRDEEPPLGVRVLLNLLPWVVLLGFWVWLSSRAQKALGAGGGMLGGMLKGRTRRFSQETDVRVRFDDVAGLASAKRDLREVVEFLRDPAPFRRLGARIPRGVLLVGPPGTGKTLLARAVAGEAGVPFFSINGSEFIELFVGVGAARVRELFETAKKEAPAIVFIDELDAVGRARGTGLGGGHDEREQTLNQLLSEMDGFTRNDLTVVLSATNRPDVLDPALLRPGRFDRRVVVDRPERPARRAILEVHARGKPLTPDVNLEELAAATPGYSGADLANLVNEAALLATRRSATAIGMTDFWAAQDKLVIGDPRETPLSLGERQRIAVHESGHAIVAHESPLAEPVRRVSILPRGHALGATTQLPKEERHIAARSELETRLRVLLGGYAAERLMLGEVSTGAQNDLKQATDLAYDMVAHFGMSDAIGPVFYEQRTEHPFLGQRLAVETATSEATSHQIDLEVQRILAAAAGDAKALLEERRYLVDRLAGALLEKETIEREELVQLLEAPPSSERRRLAGAA